MTKILYPYRLDTYSPISKIYREVGRRIDYPVVGIVGSDPPSDIDLSGLGTVRLKTPGWRKRLTYLRAYLGKNDLIHGPSVRHTPLSLLAQIVQNCQVMSTFHNAEELAPDNGAYFSLYRRMMATKSDIITSVSPFVRDVVAEAYGRKAHIVPNGVDLEQYRPERATTKEDQFLFIGRLVNRKHPEVVLRLAERFPQCSFVVCTSSSWDPEMGRTFRTLDNVQMTGSLTEDELARLYAGSAATLCPFEREGFGMVVIESLASGTPVIGLDDGNLPALIEDEHNGLLCPSTDVDDWVGALESVRRNPDRFDSRQSILQYTWENVAEQYELLYDELLDSS